MFKDFFPSLPVSYSMKVKAEDGASAEPEDILSKVSHLRLKTAASVAQFKFNKKRVRVISEVNDVPDENHGIVYWMSRDQRVQGKGRKVIHHKQGNCSKLHTNVCSV